MIVDELAPTLSTDEAADLFGCTPDTLYELVKRGEAPVEPLRLGRRLRWPTRKVLAVLGIEPTHTEEVTADAHAP